MKHKGKSSNISPALAYAKFVDENPLIAPNTDVVKYAAERYATDVIDKNAGIPISRSEWDHTDRKKFAHLERGHNLLKRFFRTLDDRFDALTAPSAEDYIIIQDLMLSHTGHKPAKECLREKLKGTTCEGYIYEFIYRSDTLYSDMVVHHLMKPLEQNRRERLMDEFFSTRLEHGRGMGDAAVYVFDMKTRLNKKELERLRAHFKPLYNRETQRYDRLLVPRDSAFRGRLGYESNPKEVFEHLERTGEMNFHGYTPRNENATPVNVFHVIGNLFYKQLSSLFKKINAVCKA